MRRIVRDWRVALIATLAFAFSGAIAVHSRILRSELVAACPVIFALMILIAIGRRAGIARPLGMAVAAATLRARSRKQSAGDPADRRIAGADLAVRKRAKRQASRSGAMRDRAGRRRSWRPVAGAAAAWLAWPLMASGFDRALLDAAQFHPLLLGRFGIYQAALLALIGPA